MPLPSAIVATFPCQLLISADVERVKEVPSDSKRWNRRSQLLTHGERSSLCQRFCRHLKDVTASTEKDQDQENGYCLRINTGTLILSRILDGEKCHAYFQSHKECIQGKGFVLQIVALCLSVVVTGLTIQSTAAAMDTMSFLSNGKENLELPRIPTEFPPLKDLTVPTCEKVILPNGLRVFLLEDHELGLVGGQLLVKGGSRNDPVDKLGLALISSTVQRSGGTTQHPAERLDTILEETAARIETSSSVSEMSVGFRCLSEDLNQVLSMFSEVVQHPLMPKDKLELTRTQLLGSIKRRGDNAQGIAAREFAKLLYGKYSAYSQYFTEETLKSISEEDLLEFHRDAFSPNSAVLGIWGDFSQETIKETLVKSLGNWHAGIDTNKEVSKNFVGAKRSESLMEPGLSYYEPRVYLIDKPGLSQGFVRMGELGTTITDPDVFALDVLNDLLNGFGGLLFDQVRSKEGLAYSVYGGWTPAVEHRGSFLAGGETQIDTVPQFISSVQSVLKNVTQTAPSRESLDRAKEGIINSFVFNFIDSGQQLSRLLTYDLFGIDQDFLFNYKKKVEALTTDDILEAAKRHLHPLSEPILVVADATKLKPLLQSLKKEVVSFQPDYFPEN